MKLKSLSGLKFYSYHVGETRFGVVDSVISEKKKKKHSNDIEQDFKNFIDPQLLKSDFKNNYYLAYSLLYRLNLAQLFHLVLCYLDYVFPPLLLYRLEENQLLFLDCKMLTEHLTYYYLFRADL